MSFYGLYVITDAGSEHHVTSQAERAIAGGATIVQYRDKDSSRRKRIEEASALQRICTAAGVPLLINDDIQLAATVGAAGVHVGRDDASLREARELLGSKAISGVSCYSDIEHARAMEQGGASYVAFGCFFPSSTKPDVAPAAPGVLADAKRRLSVPMVAIGGITPENGASLIEAGADMLAIISAVVWQSDIEMAARRFTDLFAEKQK